MHSLHDHARRSMVLSALGCCALAAAGCSRSEDGGAGPIGPAGIGVVVAAERWTLLTEEAKGFDLGPPAVPRRAVVFFDPMCPHCALLWSSARVLVAQRPARMQWTPIAFFGSDSTGRGATILASADPVAAMDEHERRMRDKQGGIQIESAAVQAMAPLIAANTQLATRRLAIDAVPTVVVRYASGTVVQHTGGMDLPSLARLLGG